VHGLAPTPPSSDSTAAPSPLPDPQNQERGFSALSPLQAVRPGGGPDATLPRRIPLVRAPARALVFKCVIHGSCSERGASMRTFVRFLAFLAVFASGVLLVVSGAMWLDSVQPPPSEPVGTGPTLGEVLGIRARPPTSGAAPAPSGFEELETPAAPSPAPPTVTASPPPTRVTVPMTGTTELFNGDLYISIPVAYGSYTVDVTIGAPGLPSKTVEHMRRGDVAFYQGKRAFEIRLESISPDSSASFLIREKGPSQTLLGFEELEHWRPEQGPIPGYGFPQAPEYGQTVSGVLSVVMGLVLMVSATVLVAVRPKVRPAPPRAIFAAAKPATAQPPSAPVTLDLGPQEAPQSVSATFQTGTGRDGSLWRKVTGLHWRLIQPGWTEQQVRRLLGGPIKVRPTKAQTGEVVSVWHYCTGLISGRTKGTVTFKDGKVVGFAAPPMDYAGRWVLHTPNPEA